MSKTTDDDIAYAQWVLDCADQLDGDKLRDGRSVLIVTSRRVNASRGSLEVDPRNIRHDAFVLYHVYSNGNRTFSARFVGWCSQAKLTKSRAKGGRIVVPVPELGTFDELMVPVDRETQDVFVETQIGFDGSVIVYEWGWKRKSCRITKNGIMIDLLYEANGKAYGFHSQKKYESLASGLRELTADKQIVQPTMIENGAREWEIQNRRRRR